MNKERFLIIDDDMSICQMLENIIEDHDLGEVIDSIMEGHEAIKMIPKYQPDIVLIDLLLPDVDGIEIVKQIKYQHENIDFIMISQVSDNDMISEAYESGIGFYINKPINVIEVVSVTKRVINSQRNRRALAEISKALSKNQTNKVKSTTDQHIDEIDVIFAELGIGSEKGAKDLKDIIEKAYKDGKDFSMSHMYEHLKNKYMEENVIRSSSSKAIEQRIRRTIHSGLINIAHLGLDDFANYRFSRYSSTLFSFSEVRKAMDAIRKGDTIKVTINIKQFIKGIITLLP